MTTVVQNLNTSTAGTKPTTSGLLKGQIAFNIPDKLMFVGDGSDAHTLLDGTTGTTAPPTGKGFYEVSTAKPASGTDLLTAASATSASTADLNTAFGSPSEIAENSTGIITGGSAKGIYKYDGTDWIADPNNGTRVADVIASADVSTADTDVTALGDELSQGDVLIINDSTGLTAQTTFGGKDREAPPAGFIEGEQPIAYLYDGSEWIVFSTPLATQYAAGDDIDFSTAGNTVTIAVADVLSAGTF